MDSKTRKRGVQASRSKLEKAMIAAGFKTQASIAEQIAENENLETSPKDTVNRAFRQEKVSPHTIARIAKALGVEPYTLYLSQQESDELENIEARKDSLATVKKRPTFNKYYLLLIFPLILFIIVASSEYLFDNNIDEQKEIHTAQIPNPLLGKYSIVLNPTSTVILPLANALSEEMERDLKPLTLSPVLLKNTAMSVDIAREYQADAVLTFRLIGNTRYKGVQIYLYFQDEEHLIWTVSLTLFELEQ